MHARPQVQWAGLRRAPQRKGGDGTPRLALRPSVPFVVRGDDGAFVQFTPEGTPRLTVGVNHSGEADVSFAVGSVKGCVVLWPCALFLFFTPYQPLLAFARERGARENEGEGHESMEERGAREHGGMGCFMLRECSADCCAMAWFMSCSSSLAHNCMDPRASSAACSPPARPRPPVDHRAAVVELEPPGGHALPL